MSRWNLNSSSNANSNANSNSNSNSNANSIIIDDRQRRKRNMKDYKQRGSYNTRQYSKRKEINLNDHRRRGLYNNNQYNRRKGINRKDNNHRFKQKLNQKNILRKSKKYNYNSNISNNNTLRKSKKNIEKVKKEIKYADLNQLFRISRRNDWKSLPLPIRRKIIKERKPLIVKAIENGVIRIKNRSDIELKLRNAVNNSFINNIDYNKLTKTIDARFKADARRKELLNKKKREEEMRKEQKKLEEYLKEQKRQQEEYRKEQERQEERNRKEQKRQEERNRLEREERNRLEREERNRLEREEKRRRDVQKHLKQLELNQQCRNLQREINEMNAEAKMYRYLAGRSTKQKLKNKLREIKEKEAICHRSQREKMKRIFSFFSKKKIIILYKCRSH